MVTGPYFIVLAALGTTAAHAQVITQTDATGSETSPADLEEPGIKAEGESKAAAPTAPLTGLHAYWPGFYASLELRHGTQRVMERDRGGFHLSKTRLLNSKEIANDNTKIYVRPTIGSTFFDGRVDTAFTYVQGYRVGRLEQARVDMFNNTQWNIISGSFNPDSPYTFGPSIYSDFFNGADRPLAFVYADVGFTGEVIYQFPVPSGSLALRGYMNPNVELYSLEQRRKNKAKLQRADAGPAGSALAASDAPAVQDEATAEPPTTQQNHAVYLTYTGFWITYKPTAVTKLGITIGTDAAQVWKPTYKDKTNPDGTTSAAFSHYQTDAVVWTRLTFAYAISDKITMSNSTRHYHGGLYERTITREHPDQTEQIGPYSWENRLSLTLALY